MHLIMLIVFEDTRFYWDLSAHVFRYNHQGSSGGSNPLGGIHTVNESMCQTCDTDSDTDKLFSYVDLDRC